MGASLVYLEKPNKEIQFDTGSNDFIKYVAAGMQGWRINMVSLMLHALLIRKLDLLVFLTIIKWFRPMGYSLTKYKIANIFCDFLSANFYPSSLREIINLEMPIFNLIGELKNNGFYWENLQVYYTSMRKIFLISHILRIKYLSNISCTVSYL